MHVWDIRDQNVARPLTLFCSQVLFFCAWVRLLFHLLSTELVVHDFGAHPLDPQSCCCPKVMHACTSKRYIPGVSATYVHYIQKACPKHDQRLLLQVYCSAKRIPKQKHPAPYTSSAGPVARLGALQRNPTAGAIFSALSERIRSDLGAEEAAVYIDIGDGTLWLLPPAGGSSSSSSREGEAGCGDGDHDGDGDDGEDVFIQRGVGVVGLVAMGALPGVAAVPAGGGERAGGVDGGVDVLLLNEGLEAFDNGTTVEAALLRAARRRREGAGGGGGGGGRMGEDDARGGTVRNMLLAR